MEESIPPVELTPQQLGSLLAKSSKKIDKPCLECNVTMRAVTVRREFCSPRCRQRHWLRRLHNLKSGEEMVYVRRTRGEPGRTAEQD